MLILYSYLYIYLLIIYYIFNKISIIGMCLISEYLS